MKFKDYINETTLLMELPYVDLGIGEEYIDLELEQVPKKITFDQWLNRFKTFATTKTWITRVNTPAEYKQEFTKEQVQNILTFITTGWKDRDPIMYNNFVRILQTNNFTVEQFTDYVKSLEPMI